MKPLPVWSIVAGPVMLGLILGVLGTDQVSSALESTWARMRGQYTVEDRLEMHGEDVRARVAPAFAAAGVAYPPRSLALVAFKDRRRLELYARDAADGPWVHVKNYPILGMSGRLGPKLREGDKQVPEGVYRAEFLNANSRYHVSIRLDYPNAADRRRGAIDGREALGSDIMIHGTRASIGCLAMGNAAAEDLFVLAALVGKENVRVIIAPMDLRRAGARPDVREGPAWLPELYQELTLALGEFRASETAHLPARAPGY